MQIKTVFFDLDGTLLPMDQDVFLKTYFGLLTQNLARHGYAPEKLTKAVWGGTKAMIMNDGRATNEQVFWEYFLALFGERAREDVALFEAFYANEFDRARTSCGFSEKAAEVIAKVKQKGLRAVLATNPLFPAVATHARIGWAGLEKDDFDHITTYENSSFCKPNPMYFQEILDKLGLRAQECVMVGNDTSDDLAAEKLGMPVFILTDCLINEKQVDIAKYPHGSFEELIAWIETL